VINLIGIQCALPHRLATRLQGQIEMRLCERILPQVADRAADDAMVAKLRHRVPRRVSGGGEHLCVSQFPTIVSHIACDAPTAAFALFGMMMGTLQLARTVPGRRQSRRILEAGIEAALALTKGPGMRGL
jgi:hypothetical protein